MKRQKVMNSRTIEQVTAYLDDMLGYAKMCYNNTAVTLYLDNDNQLEVGYSTEYSCFYWSNGIYGYYSLNRVIKDVIRYLIHNNLQVEEVEEV